MNGPICPQDLKTGKLCLICAAKLKAGQINPVDLKIMQITRKLENYKFLLATEFVRAFELNGLVLIFAKGNVGALIGREGKNIKVFEKELGKRVRVVELSNEPKAVIQQVLGRARISAVNKIFRPEGTELKVIVEARARRGPLGAQRDELKKVFKAVLKTPVEISFS